MTNKVAVFVVLYPTQESYIRDYTDSLRAQTYKDFDLVIVNDKSIIDSTHFLFKDLNVVEFKYSSTISKNREYGINKIVDNGYENIIFTDIDDYYESTRIEKTVQRLQDTDIVVNDLNIVLGNRKLQVPKYFSKAISSEVELDLQFVLKHSVFGFSNTGIKTNIIGEQVVFPSELRIVDWFFYTQLLRKGHKVIFINEALTNYRQYIDNLIGIGYYNIKNFKKLSKLKFDHFDQLAKNDPFFESYKEKSKRNLQLSDETIYKIINKKKKEIENPLWWEIVNI